MRDCCKTGDEQPAGSWRKWTKWLVYAAVSVALAIVLLQQLTQ